MTFFRPIGPAMPKTLVCLLSALMMFWPTFASAGGSAIAPGSEMIMRDLLGAQPSPRMSVRPDLKLAVDCAAERELCSDSIPCCPEAPNCECRADNKCFCH